MRTEEPRAIALADYRPPDYRIFEIALDFVLEAETTRVRATSKIIRIGAGPLKLNGEQLKLVWLKIDGQAVASDASKPMTRR